MEIQYDFDLTETSDFDDYENHGLERCAFSPEDSGDGDDSESIESDVDKRVLPCLEKTDSCAVKSLVENQDTVSDLIAAESESSSDGDWWEEAQRAAEELRHRCEQDRMQREREKLMRRMRANYRTADFFSAFHEEEEIEDLEEDCRGFSWKATRRAWLRDLPTSVATPSNFRIVRTCVTEPDVVEVIVDFRRSNEL